MKYKKCPVCKRRMMDDSTLYVEQTYSTEVKQWMSPITGDVDDDMDMVASGYTDLYDFISNMLVPTGKPIILGCDNCIE